LFKLSELLEELNINIGIIDKKPINKLEWKNDRWNSKDGRQTSPQW
jgi:hypothetical protein